MDFHSPPFPGTISVLLQRTILDENYETNLSFYKKMHCFYMCPFPPHSMLTKLHRDVSLSFNIDIGGERRPEYS